MHSYRVNTPSNDDEGYMDIPRTDALSSRVTYHCVYETGCDVLRHCSLIVVAEAARISEAGTRPRKTSLRGAGRIRLSSATTERKGGGNLNPGEREIVDHLELRKPQGKG